MVSEDDAKVFVVDALQMLAAKGHNPVITPANEQRLVHLGMLMLDAFGVIGPAAEDSDG